MVKEKTFFIIFKGLSVAKNCLIPDSASLSVLAGIAPGHFASFEVRLMISYLNSVSSIILNLNLQFVQVRLYANNNGMLLKLVISLVRLRLFESYSLSDTDKAIIHGCSYFNKIFYKPSFF